MIWRWALIVLMGHLSLANWQHEEVIVEEKNQLFVNSVYTEGKSPYISHILYNRYTKSGSILLVYIAIDTKQQIVKSPVILSENATAGAIDGGDDNLHLFVTYQQSNSTSDYLQLYFTESADGGSTWTAPRRLGNYEKIVGRSDPQIVAQKASGRLWVFYIAQGDDGSFHLTMLTRPKNSVVFTAEKFIYNATSVLQRLEASYTSDTKGNTRLHLQWAYDLNITSVTVVYSRSKDNGQTWSPIRIMQEHNPLMLYTLSSSNSLLTPVIVSTTLAGSDSLFRVSEDGGNRWADPIHFLRVGDRDTVVCGNGSYNGTYAFILFGGSSVLHFAYMPTHKAQRATEVEPPFKQNYTQATSFISCYYTSPQVITVNAFSTFSGAGLYTLKHNYYTFKLS